MSLRALLTAFAAAALLVPPLSSASAASDASASSTNPLFRKTLRTQGDDDVHSYRIPGIATTPTGTLIAVFDVRHRSIADLPGDIDVGAMRSTDNGFTWGPMRAILDFDKNVPGTLGNGVGDPCIVVDRTTGTIFVFALWSQGDRGWNGSTPGLSPEETGQLVYSKSEDDGLTWSAPTNITAQVKNPAWRLLLEGPGAGIQLRNGTLVVPAQYRDAQGTPHSLFVWSEDHGVSWKASPSAVNGTPHVNEAQIAELSDGALLLSMRDASHGGQRIWSRFEHSGALGSGRWSSRWATLPDPTCAAGLVRHPSGTLIFSNPASSTQRVRMTVRASRDDGRTWNSGRLIDESASAYSCLTVLADGRIGLLYEARDARKRLALVFAAFQLDWVLSAPDSTP